MAGFADPQSLGDLSSIIERTLLDTGRVFRKSGSMTSRAHVQRSIPFYHDSFQNALDNLSEQIFIAKAFLEKDYEALKATSAVPQPIEDVAMSDVNQKVEPEAQSLVEKVESGTELEQPALKLEEGIPVNQPAPETKPDIQDDHVVVKKESDSKAPDSAFPGTNEDLNFDSVLNDTGGTNDFDLSLDFNDNDMGNQAFLSGSNFAGAGATGATEKPVTSQPMEATASTGGGAFDMELQKTEGDDNFLQGNATDDFMAPAESNFDDLFMDTDNFGENGGDFNQLEGDSLMNVNELDDNWFN